MPKKLNLIGHKYGRLTVLSEDGKNSSGKIKWKCLCVCGNTHSTTGNGLRTGSTQSCGCLEIEVLQKRNFKHGDAARGKVSRLNNIWCNAKARATCKSGTRDYDNYAGRGITWPKEWNEYEPFKKWALSNGYKSNLTLERKDNDLPYSESNCIWANNSTQMLNQRRSIKNKLTKSEINEIKKRHSIGVTEGRLSIDFNVSRPSIKKIIKGYYDE